MVTLLLVNQEVALFMDLEVLALLRHRRHLELGQIAFGYLFFQNLFAQIGLANFLKFIF